MTGAAMVDRGVTTGPVTAVRRAAMNGVDLLAVAALLAAGKINPA